MNMETITVQDCLDMQIYKGFAVVINDGKVVEFIDEQKTDQVRRG